MGSLRVGNVLGEEAQDASAQEFAKATVVRPFDFPLDHGAHPGYQTEWWYLTGVLRDAQAREYGFQYTLFRFGLFPRREGHEASDWRNGQVYMAHMALSDVAGERHLSAQRLVRGHPRLAGVRVDPWLSTWLEDWRFHQRDETEFALTAQDADAFGLALEFVRERPIMLQGEDGLSPKGPGQASFYYSMPRLRTEGVVSIAGANRAVEGFAWLDREWSTSVLGPDLKGWNWFALHLADGRDLMAFTLERHDGGRDPHNHGQIGDAQVRRVLSAEDFTLEPTRYWRGPHGGSWPVAWRLVLGEGTYTIEAAFDDQLMDDLFVYWEGMVRVRDGEGAQVGEGYMELTGYADTRRP